MLEESRMDKKSSNRSSQPQSRASAIDCKKNTELTHKPGLRNNKKREGNGSVPKNEPYRKNAPSQRGRGQFDRRPHPRGSAGLSVGGTPNSRIKDDDEPEIGSVFVPGSKKQNLNHLLNFNFMYPARGAADRRGPQPRRQAAEQRPHRHERDLYLRAYCQFVVKDDGDYKANLLDPDIPLDIPLEAIWEASPPILPLEYANDAPYCKLFSATKKQLLDILLRERKEIENQILAEIDTTEIVYLEQALEMLKIKEQNINGGYDKLEMRRDDIETVPIVYEKQEINTNKLDWFDVTDDGAACVDTVQQQMADLDVASAVQVETPASDLNPDAPAFDIHDLQHVEFPLTECPPPEEHVEDNTITDIDKQNQAKYFYFYQAEDGQQVFLNSLNVRVLNASWGALAAAPSVIRGRVLHRETFSLTEQTRKHMPCTAHLPLYCAFDIVEMELQPPYATNIALQGFTEEIERRARQRARQEREERRRERWARRAAEGPPRPDFSSPLLFPPAPPTPHAPHTPPSAGPPRPAEPSGSPGVGSPPSGPSFAKMASSSGTWRVRKAASSASEPTAAVAAAAEEEEGAAPRALVLSDAIEAALYAAASSSTGKKKKSKQKLLFATGMQRTF